MNNIIVVGYPKSGSTWITRLTAELIGCPVTGFWNAPSGIEMACEGRERTSEYRCYKAHHQLGQLNFDLPSVENRIIYVIRDPRDVAISGGLYFRFDTALVNKGVLRKMHSLQALYSVWYKLFKNKKQRISEMISTIIYGNDYIPWCSIPWKMHYTPYYEKKVLFVRYEDMLEFPERECNRIIKYIDIHRETSAVQRAIMNQSFSKKKRSLIRKGKVRKAMFLRSGNSAQWKYILDKRQRDIFVTELRSDLQFFGYEI